MYGKHNYSYSYIYFAGTRETAFLNAIISAGICREVARKCREQKLEFCACDFSVEGKTVNGTTVIGGCGDNDEFAVKIATQFTGCETSLSVATGSTSVLALHNSEVGRTVSYCVARTHANNLVARLAIHKSPC